MKITSIEKTISGIQNALAQNPDPGFPHAERRARQEAADAVEVCKEALHRIRPKSSGSVVDPAAERAQAELSRAEEQLRSATKRLADAKDARAEAFMSGVRNHIDESAPHLSAVVSIIEDAIRPLVELHEYASRQGLPVPRTLDAVTAIQAGVSALRLIVNSSATV